MSSRAKAPRPAARTYEFTVTVEGRSAYLSGPPYAEGRRIMLLASVRRQLDVATNRWSCPAKDAPRVVAAAIGRGHQRGKSPVSQPECGLW